VVCNPTSYLLHVCQVYGVILFAFLASFFYFIFPFAFILNSVTDNATKLFSLALVHMYSLSILSLPHSLVLILFALGELIILIFFIVVVVVFFERACLARRKSWQFSSVPFRSVQGRACLKHFQKPSSQTDTHQVHCR
jgi:hypothetical protein